MTFSYVSTSDKNSGNSRTIYLDIAQRIAYIGAKPSCKESFLGRERNPQRTQNSFFAGFFIKPRRVSYRIYQKLAKKGKEVWDL